MSEKDNLITARITSVENLTDAEILKWIELCNSEAVLPSAFLTYQFAKAVSAVHPRVRICVLQQNLKPIGFLPYQFRNVTRQSLSAAERIGMHLSDYFGLIADDGLSTNPVELLKHAKLSHLNFSHLDETQKKYGLEGDKTTIGISYDISKGAEAYWEEIKKRDKKFHAHTMRQERRIQRELGPLRLVFDLRDESEALNSLIAQKRKQYAATNAYDVFSEEWCRNLLFQLYETHEPSCHGVLTALYAGDTRISMHMGLRCQDRLHIWFPVYDPAVSRFSPGRLLLKALIDNCSEHGINVLDDGEATPDQMQKRLMGNSQHDYSRGSWYQSGLCGYLARADDSLRWKLAKLHKRVKLIDLKK